MSPFARVQFWVPILDPQPNRLRGIYKAITSRTISLYVGQIPTSHLRFAMSTSRGCVYIYIYMYVYMYAIYFPPGAKQRKINAHTHTQEKQKEKQKVNSRLANRDPRLATRDSRLAKPGECFCARSSGGSTKVSRPSTRTAAWAGAESLGFSCPHEN